MDLDGAGELAVWVGLASLGMKCRELMFCGLPAYADAELQFAVDLCRGDEVEIIAPASS